MQLLDLVRDDGLVPMKMTSVNGGEYHSPCPGCGGKDRFIIWVGRNLYFCRQCRRKGDDVQYLRDFHALSYSQACCYTGKKPELSRAVVKVKQEHFVPKNSELPKELWQQKALEFIQSSHQNLFNSSYSVGLFLQRGFTIRTMKQCLVGWNPRPLWLSRVEWGLPCFEDKKLWIPRGLVLPTFDTDLQAPIKLKIRRDDWEMGDNLPKYVEITGGMQSFGRYGYTEGQPIILVESEFDAMLIQQVAGDIVSPMALGGSSKRPDAKAHELLQKAPLILFSLDVDSAGAIAYQWWKKVYLNLSLWLVPIGKSPAEAYRRGVNLREWIGVACKQ